jgi:hypothetical protein
MKKFNNKKIKRNGNNPQSLRLARYTSIPVLMPGNELAWDYTRWHRYIAPLYVRTATNDVSFINSSDTRFISFATVLTGMTSFVTLESAFRYYTILAVELKYEPAVVDQQLTVAGSITPLYVIPEDNKPTPSNPPTASVASSMSSLVHPFTKLTPTSKRYIHRADPYSTFLSVMNTKYFTGNTPVGGQVSIGTDTFSAPVSNILIGTLLIHLCIKWEGSAY